MFTLASTSHSENKNHSLSLKTTADNLIFPSGTPSIIQKKKQRTKVPVAGKTTETRRISLGDQDFNLPKVEREDSSKSAQREMFIGCLLKAT